MKYKVDGIIINSHNSAKPVGSASNELNAILKKYLDKDYSVLDYGCGKLRYSIPVSKNVKNVVAIDSDIQISRKIFIKGEATSVKEFAVKFKNITVFSTDDEIWRNQKYNIILLIHVLSSIPIEKDRLSIIKDIHSIMDDNTKLICCTAHRMSYFKKWEASSKVIHYNDGYLILEPTPCYFGVIDKNKMKHYFYKNFKINELFICGDNTYCICMKK